MGLREKSNSSELEGSQKQGTAPQPYQSPRHYHDGDVEFDAIERLKSNILMLDDLQSRLRFMNNEIEAVIGSKKKS